MTSVRDVLLDQLAACHNDESWFKSSTTILDDISVADATRKTSGHSSSIWEIVNHLIYWNEMWLRRFVNDEVIEKHTIENDETFKMDYTKIDEAGWNEARERLNQSFLEWRDTIRNCEESKLERRIPSYFNAQWWGVISNLCIHNAYHIGQLMVLKKQS
ncbi:DinB family protein [Paenibacillus sp. CF384]|uniref:DinB family protein n=1 Tax=Paenibacillus sp. CF384 TaxID=1884382 RepID=UPI00089454DA|nr:DinB family protein [Paenibacillus sp. CF384]SDX46133.1 DinB superfamily protein [Paenibacillus sp. CF384]